MSKTGTLHAYWLLLFFAFPAFALQSPTPGGAAEVGTEPAQPQYLEQGAQPEQRELPVQDAGPQLTPAETRGKTSDTFTPTERIEADSAVSFPVDI